MDYPLSENVPLEVSRKSLPSPNTRCGVHLYTSSNNEMILKESVKSALTPEISNLLQFRKVTGLVLLIMHLTK